MTGMNERIRDAFGSVHAEEALKERTRRYLSEQTEKRQRAFVPRPWQGVLAAACLLLALTGGWLWFTPTAAISIDINPSLELGVNRFDRVVSVEGYNDDGQALADCLSIRFADYEEAVTRVLESEEVAVLLSEDGALAIAVAGQDQGQCRRMLAGLETCTAGQQNAYCYAATQEELEQAHALGLSCGRYRAYLALQSLDPAVTPEDVQEMSMREIRDRIALLSGEETGDGGHRGQGNGFGWGWRDGA